MSESDKLDWPTTAMGLGVLTLCTIVIVVVIWQAAVTWRARAKLAREDEYRGLAARATVAQEKTAAELAELRARLDAVEEVLHQVD